MAPPDGPSSPLTIRWFLFNAGWDHVMNGAPAAVGAAVTARYLDYLAVALESFRQRHPGTTHGVEVWLVEIARDGLDVEGLRRELEARGVRQRYSVALVGQPVIAHLLAPDPDRADAPRSPNRLHEHLIFFAVDRCPTRFLSVLDPDLLCTEDGIVDRVIAAIEAHPEAWAASFVEAPHDRPWRGRSVRTRERMHTVALFFDATALRKHLPMRRFLERGPEAQLAGHPVKEIAAEYRERGFRDSLSYLTEWLRHGLGPDRLLDLGTVLAPVHEGPNLTIVSQGLLHWKHRDAGARTALARTLGELGREAIDDPWVEKCLEAAARAGG